MSTLKPQNLSLTYGNVCSPKRHKWGDYMTQKNDTQEQKAARNRKWKEALMFARDMNMKSLTIHQQKIIEQVYDN